MKSGDQVWCPRCNATTVVKSKPLLTGWRQTDEVLVCPLCGDELGRPEAPEAASNSGAFGAAAKLAALLGEVETAPQVVLDDGSAARDFCRNCRNFIVHPFKTVCALTEHDTDPMASCPKFEFKNLK